MRPYSLLMGILSVTALLVTPLPPTVAADAPAPTCLGRTATVVGTHGDDRLRGTPGSDVIAGRGGDDVILGFGGNDLLCGGYGNDVVIGGTGHDRLAGGEGDDVLYAGAGADRLFGNAGDDTLDEGGTDAPLADRFTGGPGVDMCSAGSEDAVRQCEGPGQLVSFELSEGGASVLVTFSLACAPHGPETATYFSLGLYQGEPGAEVQGNGGILAPPSFIYCDGTSRSYSFNIRPIGEAEGARYAAGPAVAEWQVITCTLVAPETTECTGAGLVREDVTISP